MQSQRNAIIVHRPRQPTSSRTVGQDAETMDSRTD